MIKRLGSRSQIMRIFSSIFLNVKVVNQLPAQQKHLRFWFDLELLKLKYSIKQDRANNPVQNPTAFEINQFKLDWQNLYFQYFQSSQSYLKYDLSNILNEFSLFINCQTDSMIKKDEKKNKKKFTFDPKHAKYKKSYGYSKTVQMYFSIEGIMQKQAFLEDIGNFRNQGDFEKFSPQTYYWAIDRHCKQKRQINKLIKMTAQKKTNQRISEQDAYYKLVFPSFHSQIRNLRNLLSHYTYVKKQNKQYSLQYKLQLIEKSFPKLFVFIYRWKPYLNKNFDEIKKWRQDILLDLFKHQGPNQDQIINRLYKIKLFKDNYKVLFSKQNLLKYFGYNRQNNNSCGACKILVILMQKNNQYCIYQLIIQIKGLKDKIKINNINHTIIFFMSINSQVQWNEIFTSLFPKCNKKKQVYSLRDWLNDFVNQLNKLTDLKATRKKENSIKFIRFFSIQKFLLVGF